ncbi:MAG TPA: transposase [Burkholderiales bacterium]|nr:transposase [Burkholderiales bacterium]
MLNRANARRRIFERDADYAAFKRTLAEVQQRIPMRVLAWCLMPNHWHLVLWPGGDEDLSRYMRLVTLTHTQRWHAHRATAGTGHVYQGRFKSFVVQGDEHFLTVCRYVEGNALRANLVERAEHWRWSSLWRTGDGAAEEAPSIAAWPITRPADWTAYVNQTQAPTELDAVRKCARRGTPYGDDGWAKEVASRLSLTCTLRDRGRPRKRGQDPFSSLALEKGS